MADSHSSTRAVLFALGANSGIAVAKTVAAFITGSSAMAAEAVHSFADAGNQGLLLWGMKQAKRPATSDYPLGFGRATYFWSFIVALLLFSLGGLFSLYEGYHKLQSGEELVNPWVAIGVLAFAIVLEMVSLVVALREIRKVQRGRSLWRWFRETRHSELIVVLGEDLAATFGLLLALIAVGVTMLTGNPLFDALGSMAIGVLLLVVSVAIAIEIKGLLIGQSASPHLVREITAYLESCDLTVGIHDLKTVQLGPDVMLVADLVFDRDVAGGAMVDAIGRYKRELGEKFSNVKWIFFNPEYRDAPRRDVPPVPRPATSAVADTAVPRAVDDPMPVASASATSTASAAGQAPGLVAAPGTSPATPEGSGESLPVFKPAP